MTTNSKNTHNKTVVETAWAKEYEAMIQAYAQSGGDPDSLQTPKAAVLVVSANRVLAQNEIPGVSFEAEELSNGVRAKIKVEEGTQVEKPVHLCFGMLPEEGEQQILANYDIGAGAKVQFLAHCTFPNALRLKHMMDAHIHVGKNAEMTYHESHYHGNDGGIEVLPKASVTVDEGGLFRTSFSLIKGRVGKMEFDYDIHAAKNSVTELTTKAYGYANDEVKVNETIHLDGENARSLTKTRIAVRDDATSDVYTITEGNAPNTKGHMDCTEIVRGKAIAGNVPKVVVKDERAHITHEAAIGSVNNKELETLMARGLDEDTAVDIIIRGMLREGGEQ